MNQDGSFEQLSGGSSQLHETTEVPSTLSGELFQGSADLEGYLLGLKVAEGSVDPNGLLSYRDLPHTLTVAGIEDFSNNLLKRTVAISPREEFGGYIHLQVTPPKLLYPISPTMGYRIHNKDEKTYRQGVEPFYVITPNIQPISLVHTHIWSGTFSAQDIFHMVRSDELINSICLPLSTPQFNFLLLRTRETQPKSIEEFNTLYSKYRTAFFKEGALYQDKSDNALQEILASENLIDFNDILIDDLNDDVQSYFTYLLTTQAVARELMLGIYISEKDGKYQLLTEGKAREVFENLFSKLMSTVTEK